jgi:alpha-tubulin suppressor-like RCC1 family protein
VRAHDGRRRLLLGREQTCVTGTTTSGSETLSPHKIALAASDATFVSLSAGDATAVHACAVRNNDTLWCWGSNYNFELGQSSTNGTACSDNGFDVPKQVAV